MKIQPRCILCQMNRALTEIERVNASPQLNRKAMLKAMKKCLEIYEANLTPAELGTGRYQAISRVLDVERGYKDLKKRSNEAASKVLIQLKDRMSSPISDKRFHQAFFWAAAGNSFDFGPLDHTFLISDFESSLQEMRLGIDERDEIYEMMRPGQRIVYLVDNAGEILFDRYLMDTLRKMGGKVTLGVKKKNFQNDVTYNEISQLGLCEVVDSIITTEAAFFGLGKGDIERITDFDLIISKGMGNFEVLEERVRHGIVFSLKAKCLPVASTLGVNLGEVVIHLR
ncbi:MAG: DUF89 family protein [Nitrososphaeria archaeon]|nr:DUF89 family protein [Nitrososphaeria archaeon]NIN52362.1 DUF89 family protein [Nitrososphaeria archaeon]NIQ32850.1 DUF89 family protein [Nitrososphaeria archaeon]